MNSVSSHVYIIWSFMKNCVYKVGGHCFKNVNTQEHLFILYMTQAVWICYTLLL